MPAEDSLGDQFEQLIERNQLTFRPASLSELDDWGRALVGTFLRHESGITWQLGEPTLGAAYCLQLSDDYLQYLDIYPQTRRFMWCTDDHHDSVHPDETLAYLLVRSHPGMRVQVLRDERTGLRRLRLEHRGQVMIVDDIRNFKLP